MTASAPLNVATVPFSKIQNRMNRLWDPFERNSQIGVFGITGAGKSHVIRYGILPVCNYGRVLLIDVKGNRDSVWAGFGETVGELPPAFSLGAGVLKWHLVVDRQNAQAQLRRVFAQLREEGHCVIVMDESRSITEREQMGLGSVVENLILEGRGLGLSMIMGAQSTAWAVSALKDQPSTLLIGLTGSREQAGKLADIAGYGRELAEVIAGVPARRWLYRDSWEDTPVLALAEAPPAPVRQPAAR